MLTANHIYGRSIMLRRCFISVPVLVSASLVVGSLGGSNMGGEISRAVVAPYVAFLHRDAVGLCADFTASTANRLARNISNSARCETRVREAFAESWQGELVRPVRSHIFKVDHVSWHGNRARAMLSYGGTHIAQVTITLEKTSGGWRVSTPPLLVLLKGCLGDVHARRCPKGARTVIFMVGVPTGASQPHIAPPPAVKRAGGHELREFDAGSEIAVESGCLACHRIGRQGHSGPGPALTHVGSMLSEREIEHALVDPTEPMPAFRHLPKTKFAAVVKFLALLR